MKEKNRMPTTPGDERDQSIFSGEIETGETALDRAAALEALAGDFQRDAQLQADWEATAETEDPLARIEALLDRLNAHRREPPVLDLDEGAKKARDRMFSDLINRLRGLI